MIKPKDYKSLKKKIFLYFILRPIKLIENIFFLLSIISRSSININENNNKRYLHLLHLVILKNKFKKTSPKNKDKIINFFFNKIVKNFNANYIYLCYENDNNKAHYYYKRNKYKIYNKINNTFFVKKFFK